MWVKICGNTNIEDALAAAEAGADALGFVFAPSPRRISPREAARIIRELPDKIEKVGIFVNQAPELILNTVEKAGLLAVQLHGEEPPETVAELARHVTVYKAVPLGEAEGVDENDLEAFASSGATALLVDSSAPGRRGGTGRKFRWEEAAPALSVLGRRIRIIVAGGLNPANVAEAIERLHPWGVDVVSGVEGAPGKKDHDKIRAFLAQAKNSKLKMQNSKR